jgi:prgE
MKFERKSPRDSIPFLKEGKHDVTIQKVELTKSKRDSEMLKMIFVGQNGERAYYYLVFGTEYTEDYLQYLLTSIEDHGYDIPDLDFGYNKETAEFLVDKEIYINITAELDGKQKRYRVSKILTLSEYENSYEDEESNDDFPFSEE